MRLRAPTNESVSVSERLRDLPLTIKPDHGKKPAATAVGLVPVEGVVARVLEEAQLTGDGGGGLFAIEGGGASGKSWLLRKLAVDLCDAQLGDGGPGEAWLPLRLSLAALSQPGSAGGIAHAACARLGAGATALAESILEFYSIRMQEGSSSDAAKAARALKESLRRRHARLALVAPLDISASPAPTTTYRAFLSSNPSRDRSRTG